MSRQVAPLTLKRTLNLNLKPKTLKPIEIEKAGHVRLIRGLHDKGFVDSGIRNAGILLGFRDSPKLGYPTIDPKAL